MKDGTGQPIQVLDLTEQEGPCRACLEVSAQPWLLSNGTVYCWRCVEELLDLGWAEWVDEAQTVMSGSDQATGCLRATA